MGKTGDTGERTSRATVLAPTVMLPLITEVVARWLALKRGRVLPSDTTPGSGDDRSGLAAGDRVSDHARTPLGPIDSLGRDYRDRDWQTDWARGPEAYTLTGDPLPDEVLADMWEEMAGKVRRIESWEKASHQRILDLERHTGIDSAGEGDKVVTRPRVATRSIAVQATGKMHIGGIREDYGK